MQNIKAANEKDYPVKIKSWKVKVGDEVKRDDFLGIYESMAKEITSHQIRSLYDGTIHILEPIGFIADSSIKHLGKISEICSHSVQLHGLCALCGKDLSIAHYSGSDTNRATINMTHDSLGVKISVQEATRLEQGNTTRLKEQRKLSLLLDLDQTVIHATIDDMVGEWLQHPENPSYPTLTEVYAFSLNDSPAMYYIKLRPGTREFLAALEDKYEMHIYTMGTRNYAHAVANILDPDKSYFKDRILSRDDSGSFVFKDIKRLFPVDQSMVVAIDDRADVWQWSPNLIKVRPYNYFLGIGDINEPLKAGGSRPIPTADSAIPSSTNESSRPIINDDDIDLKYVKRTMTALHATFFNRLENPNSGVADVCHILPWMKLQILKGTGIVFSGVIPIGQELATHELWIIATRFGAKCFQNVTEETTHLIAAKPGTAKEIKAREISRCHVVKPEWLVNSIIQWHRLPEAPYYINPSLPGPIDKTDNSTDDADWSHLNKEVDEFLDETDSNNSNQDSDDGSLERSDKVGTADSAATSLSGSERESFGTEDESKRFSDNLQDDSDSNSRVSSDGWLENEIGAGLDGDVEIPSLKRKAADQDI